MADENLSARRFAIGGCQRTHRSGTMEQRISESVRISMSAATAALVLLPTSVSASVDCEALRTWTIPFQITSEDVMTAHGTSKTISVVSQVHRDQNGTTVSISSLPGRKRKTTSRYGLDVERLMESASGRSMRMVTSNVPDKDMLGQKRDFSLDTSVHTSTNATEVPVTETYHFTRDGTVELSGCRFPVLEYSVDSSLMSTHTEFAYSPDLRVKLRSKETNPFGGASDSTADRALSLTTSFEALPEPKP